MLKPIKCSLLAWDQPLVTHTHTPAHMRCATCADIYFSHYRISRARVQGKHSPIERILSAKLSGTLPLIPGICFQFYSIFAFVCFRKRKQKKNIWSERFASSELAMRGRKGVSDASANMKNNICSHSVQTWPTSWRKIFRHKLNWAQLS